MAGFTPVSIPRWQWRTSASDLSWLRRRLSSPGWLTSPPSDQTHLICLHSAQHAWLETGELELQWRKETGAEGFELWDTILRAAEPFDAASLARLYSAWGLAAPRVPPGGLSGAALLAGPIAATPSVRALRIHRSRRQSAIDGIACRVDRITAGPTYRFESLSLEHEDPALLAQLLLDLGLEPRTNTSLLQDLKQALAGATSPSEK